MLEDTAQPRTKTAIHESGHVSWWSWRPGIKPRNALLIGGTFTIIALFFIALGLVVMALSIADSTSAPLTVAGVITHHTTGDPNGSYYLTIQLHTRSFPSTVSAPVNATMYHTLHDGNAVTLEYSPHLRQLNALDTGGQHYILPNSGAAGIVIGAIALLLLGLVMLPYPAVLARWGWRDLYSNNRMNVTGTITALRAAPETQMRRPGLMPRRGVRTWYGIALSTSDTGRGMTFAVTETMYRGRKEGEIITITCSPHIHYVYSLEQIREGK